MQEKKNQQPAQNLQMMRVEPHKYDPSVNIVTQSGTATGEDKLEGKNPMVDTLVINDGEKSIGFNM